MDRNNVDITLLRPVLEAHAKEYGSLITILQKAQDIYGYLPDAVLLEISKATERPLAEIRGVATFYAQFRFDPIGKYSIRLCNGTACHVNRSGSLIDTVHDLLGICDGETTKDGMFSLNVVACLGCCSLSPVVMINDEAYGSMTPKKLTDLINAKKAENN